MSARHLAVSRRGTGLARKTAARQEVSTIQTARRVRRRTVLYIHGFDPRGPGVYHSLFAEEARRSAVLSGRTLTVGPRRRSAGGAGWSVAGDGVETAYEFLRWDDRVRARWSRNEVALLGELAAWVGKWGRLGYFGKARREARALWLAMLSTPVVTALYMLSALAVVALAGAVAGAAAHLADLPAWIGAAPALASLLLAPRVWRWVEERLNVCWLSRCFTYMRRRAEERSDDLDERDQRFAAAIADAVGDPACDEVLVVGHSLGALHAISALARALEANPSLGQDGRLALMTLGQPVALFTVQPEVETFRRELATFADAPQIPWLDVTSPSDPASACAIDPLTDVEAPARRLLQRSPRFHLFLTQPHFQTIRRDPISFHFQYLRAPDIAGGFDYFDMVAGPARMMDHPWVRGA